MSKTFSDGVIAMGLWSSSIRGLQEFDGNHLWHAIVFTLSATVGGWLLLGGVRAATREAK